ncbi:MAG: hypothetical protein WCA11_14120, partial [Terracidiphilus sp.]
MKFYRLPKYVVLRFAPFLLICLATATASVAQDVAGASKDAQWMPDLHWRLVGPFRGGRTRAACGVPGEPNVFYVGQVDGGV